MQLSKPASAKFHLQTSRGSCQNLLPLALATHCMEITPQISEDGGEKRRPTAAQDISQLRKKPNAAHGPI